MAVRNDFTAGEVLAAADLNDTFASKLDLAGGKILQIVRATDSTSRTTTSGSLVDVTGMSVTITPQKSDSAVLLFAHFLAIVSHSAATEELRAGFALTDSSNNTIGGESSTGTFNVTGQDTRSLRATMFMLRYVTPATTSAVTYKLRMSSFQSIPTVNVANNAQTGQMYAIEVSA